MKLKISRNKNENKGSLLNKTDFKPVSGLLCVIFVKLKCFIGMHGNVLNKKSRLKLAKVEKL